MSSAPTSAETLETLLSKIRACRICIDTPKGSPLPHAPRPVIRASVSAQICVCGQAPGTKVHASGLSFMDPSGKRLRAWMGVEKEEFYDISRIAVVPMGFCFPGLNEKGGDLPPRKECAPAWHHTLFDHLPQFKIVLLVGQYAQKWHLGQAAKPTLTETVRHWRDYAFNSAGTCFVPTPHPSWRNTGWLKKNPWFEDETVPFIQKRIRQLLQESKDRTSGPIHE